MLILEPHNEHWLFALDMPTNLPEEFESRQLYSGQLLAKKDIKQRVQYQLSSYTDYSFNPDYDKTIEQSLQLPENKHPRTRQLAQQWLTETTEPEQLINKALNHFNQQAFFYTLTPPLLTGDTIDSFLFESRQGLCEHYAASFTVLMRAMGIPTRVVTGYQGGEYNPVDGYHIIRQQDAHAWTEVWLNGQGWIRVDPTAAVARDRIELGMDTIMPATMRAPLFFATTNQLVDIWQALRQNWDALNNAWNRSILAYGPELQKEFLAALGMEKPDWQTMVIYLVILFNLILAIIVMTMLSTRKRVDPVIKHYQQFCKKLKTLNLERMPSEGPADFSARIIRHYPHLENEVRLITGYYIDPRYSQAETSIKIFNNAVKQFKPSKSA
jgi:transglutaminase-like putative cysteine protease